MKKDSESDSGKIKMQRIYGRRMGKERMEDEVVEDVINKRTGELGSKTFAPPLKTMVSEIKMH